MTIGNLNAGSYTQITASTNCMKTDGVILGIFVSAASATPTITVYDSSGTATTTKIIDTFTPAAATWYGIQAQCLNGCYVVISGTVSCTVITAA